MMVDPDGTLDALTTLGITSPLTDQKMNPGTQQGASVLHPGAGAPPGTFPPSRPEGHATEFCGPSEHAEQDPGNQKSSRPYN